MLKRIKGWIENRSGRARSPQSIQRPDTLDLIGPAFDGPSGEPVTETLIICSAPRTASYELCRLLWAAGLGVPHEYFHHLYADSIWRRWGMEGDPLSTQMLDTYVDALRRRRSNNGIFATKLQFWQFDQYLRNEQGAALFQGAHIVHLFRTDVADQFASFRRALITGRWDFSDRCSAPPHADSWTEELRALDSLLQEDTGFRRLFILLNINPLFVTSDDIATNPIGVVTRIARMVGTEIDEGRLRAMVATSKRYLHDRRIGAVNGPEYAAARRELAFRRTR